MIRMFRTALAAILLALASAALAQDITQVSPTTFDGSFFARTAGKIGLAMSSASLRAALTDESGTGAAYFQGGDLGTPSAGVLTNATGLPISTGVAGLGAGVATWLGTPSSANLAAAVTDETGLGALVFGTSPTIASPALSGTATGTYTLGGTPTLSGGTLSGTTTLTGMTAGSVLFTGTSSALSQDNAKFFWDDTVNQLIVGNNVAATFVASSAQRLQVLNLGENFQRARLAVANFETSATAPALILGKSRSTSLSTAAAVLNNDGLGQMFFNGDDGSTAGALPIEAASFGVFVDGTVSTGIVPGRFTWSTRDTSGVLAERMRLTSAGNFGIGVTPISRFVVSGTLTAAVNDYSSIAGTLVSSVTGIQRGLYAITTFQPSGATVNNIYGIDSQPIIGASTPATVPTLIGVRGAINLAAAFTGTVTSGIQFNAADPIISGGSITNALQFNADVLTTNNNLASGSTTLRQYRAAGITAGASGGTVNSRGVEITVPSGGASSGTANNRGLYITGNGGTAAGGTVNNHALYSDSTAKSLLAGGMQLGTTTELTVAGGEFGLAKIAASGTAPGAAGGKIALVCGTNAGTAKLIVYAGTSTTAVTILDNIGSGVTGC